MVLQVRGARNVRAWTWGCLTHGLVLWSPAKWPRTAADCVIVMFPFGVTCVDGSKGCGSVSMTSAWFVVLDEVLNIGLGHRGLGRWASGVTVAGHLCHRGDERAAKLAYGRRVKARHPAHHTVTRPHVADNDQRDTFTHMTARVGSRDFAVPASAPHRAPATV